MIDSYAQRITAANFEEKVLQSEGLVLVNFSPAAVFRGADMQHAVSEFVRSGLAHKREVDVVEVDREGVRDWQHRYGIESNSAAVLFRDGKVIGVERTGRLFSKEEVAQWVDKTLMESQPRQGVMREYSAQEARIVEEISKATPALNSMLSEVPVSYSDLRKIHLGSKETLGNALSDSGESPAVWECRSEGGAEYYKADPRESLPAEVRESAGLIRNLQCLMTLAGQKLKELRDEAVEVSSPAPAAEAKPKNSGGRNTPGT